MASKSDRVIPRTSDNYRVDLPEDEIFVPSTLCWAVASDWLREFAETQFREICHFYGETPHLADKSPVLINTSAMLNTWGECRRQGYHGVYFRIGYDKEIWANAV